MKNRMKNVRINTYYGVLTNLDISTHCRECSWWFHQKDLVAAFAYWVVKQSPYDAPDFTKALIAWGAYVAAVYPDSDMAVEFSYSALKSLISEDVFNAIPEIVEWNHRKDGGRARFGPDDNFLDLGVLARNIFFMVMREKITQ